MLETDQGTLFTGLRIFEENHIFIYVLIEDNFLTKK